MSKVDLATYRSEESKVYAGRARGESVREAAALDTLDKEAANVEVLVPEDTYSVNSSFFLGMFGKSIRALGEQGFRAKYSFGGKDISSVVERGIREALRAKSPLVSSPARPDA